jgi:hypothetical protein
LTAYCAGRRATLARKGGFTHNVHSIAADAGICEPSHYYLNDFFFHIQEKDGTMAEYKYNVTYPACGGTIGADTEAGLIDLVQDHAKTQHQKDLSAEQVLEMAKAYENK